MTGSRHNVATQTGHFPMSNINEAFARINLGKHKGAPVLVPEK